MLLAGVLLLVLAVQIEGSISAPQARANAAIGEMGRKPKGKGVNTPKWEHRDDISPFKLAEKLFKRYTGKQTDFSSVLDFAARTSREETARADAECTTSQPEQTCASQHLSHDAVRVVHVPGREGLIILPGFLSAEDQLRLAERCLTAYPSPPHNSNLTPRHGTVERLWETRPDLLEQLRWVTLGYQYDWTNRTYRDADRVGVPPELLKYAAAASAAAGWRSAVRAEAAIVNYYTLASTLGGHLDDVEPDQESPIVSLSLGCAAVFLVGGCTKEEAPTAVFLRSGDALLMSGESRRCYHGVPRILSPDEDDVTRLLTTHWRTAATAASAAPADAAPPPAAPSSSSPAAAAAAADSSRLQEVVEYLVTHRLNINIRQVHSVREGAAARDSTALHECTLIEP